MTSTFPRRPHLLGVDDGPFQKQQAHEVPIVGVMMEGATLVEGVAVGSFPVDGARVTEYLSRWIRGQRWFEAVQGVVLGGITIAGLGVVDLEALSEMLERPVMAVTRQKTTSKRLEDALRAAGFHDRVAIIRKAPTSRKVSPGLHAACAGIAPDDAEQLLRAACHKARMPEPLRIAHLIAAAVVNGMSRGRV